MPVIKDSSYQRPFWLFNQHIETIKPALFRRVSFIKKPKRIRITTQDDDFLDLDFYKGSGQNVVIISHGLEGDSRRAYVSGMARVFNNERWDVVAWNYRGCSGEMNRRLHFYHSGSTYDLDEIVRFVKNRGFQKIALVGFSLGGNLTLKYLGESKVLSTIKAAAVFSVPLDLAGCSKEIDKPHNFLYSFRFLKSLKNKVRQKKKLMPALEKLANLKHIKSIYTFDDLITAPLSDFDSADHYYEENSSSAFVRKIQIPTLVVNAINDPFLSGSCFDQSIFESSSDVYFEMPKFGGHVGFSTFNKDGTYWSEKRAFDFISQNCI